MCCLGRQIAANIEEKWADQGKDLRGGISRIYLASSKQMETIPRSHKQQYFWFHWNCRQLRIEARNCMVNYEIYFPIFSETIHTIFKLFSQHDLRKVR